jgi:hypothetical protein
MADVLVRVRRRATTRGRVQLADVLKRSCCSWLGRWSSYRCRRIMQHKHPLMVPFAIATARLHRLELGGSGGEVSGHARRSGQQLGCAHSMGVLPRGEPGAAYLPRVETKI